MQLTAKTLRQQASESSAVKQKKCLKNFGKINRRWPAIYQNTSTSSSAAIWQTQVTSQTWKLYGGTL